MSEQKNASQKMIVFEMDDTLLRGRFIDACADKFVFDEELTRLRQTEKDPVVLIKSVGKLFQGLSEDQLLTVISRMTIIDEAAKVIKQLQKQGHIVGIISDSFQFAVDYIKKMLGADFAIGNRLEFAEGKVTGEITVPAYYYYQSNDSCDHNYCKSNALMYAGKSYNISPSETIAVGAVANDICMIQKAGVGIAFCTKDKELRMAADKTIDKLSFALLLDIERLVSETGKQPSGLKNKLNNFF